LKQICFLCGHKFQSFQGEYAGRYVARYDFMICITCDQGNWDGIASQAYIEKIITHLESKGIPIPALNEKGWLPLPARGQ
jgi:hypothetical protein